MSNSDLAVIREDIRQLHMSVVDLLGVVVAVSLPGDMAGDLVVKLSERIINRAEARYPKPESLTMGKGK